LRSDARQLQAGERQARKVELNAQPAGKGEQKVSPASQSQSEPVVESSKQSQNTESKPAQSEGENVASEASEQGRKLQEKQAGEMADGLLEKPDEQLLERAKKQLGTNSATNDDVMIATPTQNTAQPASRVAEDAGFARMTGSVFGQQGVGESAVRLATGQDGREQASQGRSRQQGTQEQARVQASSSEQADARTADASSAKQAFQVQQASQSQQSQAPAHAEMVANIMRQVERLREQGVGAMRVSIPLEEGKELKMTLRMSEDRVQIKLDAASQEIYDALNENWADLTERASRSGIRLESPIFADLEDSVNPHSGNTLSQTA